MYPSFCASRRLTVECYSAAHCHLPLERTCPDSTCRPSVRPSVSCRQPELDVAVFPHYWLSKLLTWKVGSPANSPVISRNIGGKPLLRTGLRPRVFRKESPSFSKRSFWLLYLM